VSEPKLHGGIALGVNIDHVATLRQARRARYPDPLYARAPGRGGGRRQHHAAPARDRRHIQDRDVTAMREGAADPHES